MVLVLRTSGQYQAWKPELILISSLWKFKSQFATKTKERNNPAPMETREGKEFYRSKIP